MDEILATHRIGEGCNLHIATLSRETIVNAGADHLGFDGYFVFEARDGRAGGLNILGKTCSLEAAFRLSDLWGAKAA